MSRRDRIGIGLLFVLLTLNAAGPDIRGTLTNPSLMAGISAVLAVMIPKLAGLAQGRSWGRILKQAMLGGLAGALVSLLCRFLLSSATD